MDNRRLLTAFSPLDNSLFAVLGADNHLRLWDIESGSGVRVQWTIPPQYTSKFTAIRWWRPQPDNAGSSRSSTSLGVIALGSAQGFILLFDAQRSTLLHVLSRDGKSGRGTSGVDELPSKINDLVFDPRGLRLYSCSSEEEVLEWDVKHGKLLSSWKADKHGTSRLAIHPTDPVLLTAGSTIRMWDLSSKAKIRKYSGHAAAVQHLAFHPDGSVFCSAATGERWVSVWAGDKGAGSDDKSVALRVLSLDAAPTSLRVWSSGSSAVVLATSGSGNAFIWNLDTDKASSQKRSAKRSAKASSSDGAADPQTTLRFTADAASSATYTLGIFDATIVDESSILVAHSSYIKPVFERYSYRSTDGEGVDSKFIAQVAVSGAVSSAALTESTDDSKDSSGKLQDSRKRSKVTEVLGAHSLPLSSTDIVPEAAASVETSASTASGSVSVNPKDEQTLAERVALLDMDSQRAASGASVPKADSLTAALVQALHSNDRELLEQCLAVSDVKVISKTVRKLPISSVLPFFTAVVHRFQSRPSRGMALIRWLRAIFTEHTAYLVSVPRLVDQLTGLYQIMNSRLGTFKKLMKLSGRVDLLLSQISVQAKNGRSNVASTPGFVFEDESGGESEDSEDSSDREDGEDSDDGDANDDDDDNEMMASDVDEMDATAGKVLHRRRQHL